MNLCVDFYFGSATKACRAVFKKMATINEEAPLKTEMNNLPDNRTWQTKLIRKIFE